MRADKLIFTSSQAAVQRRGNETDLFEQDTAAHIAAVSCMAQQEEEDETHRNYWSNGHGWPQDLKI